MVVQCLDCAKEFVSLSTFRRHQREIHNKSANLNKTPVQCNLCGKHFSNRSSYNRHDREVHQREIPHYVELEDTVTRFCCLDCNVYFYNNMDLRFHLDEKHEEPWELEDMEFNNFEEFNTWLLLEQSSKNLQYVLSRGSVLSEKCYYECWRSAPSRQLALQGDRKRAFKKKGSCKMPYACTSQIIMTKDIITEKCKVSYFKTHYGHEWQDDLLHLRLTGQEKEGIASKLLSGVSSKSILKEARRNKKKSHLPPSRIDMLSSRDIKNVKNQIAQDAKRKKTCFQNVPKCEIAENQDLQDISPENENEISNVSQEPPQQAEDNETIIEEIEIRLQTISANLKNEAHSFEQLQEILKSVNHSLELIEGFNNQNSDTQIITVDISKELQNEYNIEVENDHEMVVDTYSIPDDKKQNRRKSSNNLNQINNHQKMIDVKSYSVADNTEDSLQSEEILYIDNNSSHDIEFVTVDISEVKCESLNSEDEDNVNGNSEESDVHDEESDTEIITINLNEEVIKMEYLENKRAEESRNFKIEKKEMCIKR